MTQGRFEVDLEHRYDAPPEAVWRVYTDHARWSEWAPTPGSHLVKEGHPDPNGVGCVRGFAGRTHEEILRFEPPRHMTYTVRSGILPIKNHFGEVWLEADGGGTRLRWRCTFDSRIPGLGALLRKLIERTFRGALDGLEARGFD